MKKIALLAAFLLSLPLFVQAQNEGYPGQKQGENATEYHMRTGEEARINRENMEAYSKQHSNYPGMFPRQPKAGSNWAQPGLFASREEKQQFKADRKALLADRQRKRDERASRRR